MIFAKNIENLKKSTEKNNQILMAIIKDRLINNLTLEDTASNFSISKERIRQLQQKAIELIFTQEAVLELNNKITNLFLSNKQAKLFLSKSDILEVLSINEDQLTLLMFFIQHKNSTFSIVQELVVLKKNNISHFISKIKNSENIFFSSLKSNKVNTYILTASQLLLLEKLNIIVKIEDNLYCKNPKSKREAFEYWLLLIGKDGFQVIKKEIEVNKYVSKLFPIFKKGSNNILSMLNNNKNVILRDWGTYIHISYINEQCAVFNKELLAADIDSFLSNNNAYNIEKFFKENIDNLIDIEITSIHMLYSIAKQLLSDRYDFSHTPWIQKKDSARISVKEIAEDFAKKVSGPFSIKDFADFIGVSRSRATQILNTSNNIHKINENSYAIISF